MRLYFHHIGSGEAAVNVNRTVFGEVSLDSVISAVSSDDLDGHDLIYRLKTEFGNGPFNVWGVPGGASRVVSGLKSGDTVLLVKEITELGEIPALCVVKVFVPRPFPALSSLFWESERFPYVFFFNTVEIDFTWGEFSRDMEYQDNYSPRRLLSVVKDDRFEKFGTADDYVDYLIRSKSTPAHLHVFDLISDNDVTQYKLDDAVDRLDAINTELSSLSTLQDVAPQLTAGLDYEIAEVRRRNRDDAFRVAVRRAYSNKCCICGDCLVGPNGEVEVQAAHIYPKRLDGSDDIRNGLSLCRRHHWAFDVGWMFINDDLTIQVRTTLPDEPQYDFIRKFHGRKLISPTRDELSPHPKFLKEHRGLYDA